MRYAFGAAEELYTTQQHPRIAFGPKDVTTLRKKIKSDDGKKIMEAIRRKAGFMINEILAGVSDNDLILGDGSHHSLAARLGAGVNEIGIVALLDEDPRALEAMLRLFDVVVRAKPDDFRHSRVSAASLAFAYDYLHAYLPEKLRTQFCKVAVREIRNRIKKTEKTYFLNTAGNMAMHFTLKALNAVLAVKGEPGVPSLEKEQEHLVKCVEASINSAVGPNGYPEEDTGYGTGVTSWLVQFTEWVRRAGIVDLYKRCPHLLKFGRAMLQIVEPWGEDIANTGDHGDDFGERVFPLARLAEETNDPALIWLLGTLTYTHGKVHPANRMPDFWVEVPLRKGFNAPATWQSLLVLDSFKKAMHPRKTKTPTAFHDPMRGVASFRDGWHDESTFVFFDSSQRSPSGQGHAHTNSGHFILSAVGEYFGIGPGRYQMDQDQQSIVLVDGKSGYSTEGQWCHAKHEGVMTACESGAFVNYAAADASHQYEARWARRHIGLVKGKGAHGYVWTVEDINKNDDWAEFWWQLQTSPENTIQLRKTSATVKGWRHGNLLDVHFALSNPSSLTMAQDIASSSSYKYLTRNPSTGEENSTNVTKLADKYERPAHMVHGPCYVNPRLLAKVHGPCGRFMSVMLPRMSDEKAPVVKQIKSLPNSLAMQITFEEVEDILIFAYEHRMLEAADIVARGDWCVVRRDRKSGKVLHTHVHKGAYLNVAGKEIRL